jgi:hypothetical protein
LNVFPIYSRWALQFLFLPPFLWVTLAIFVGIALAAIRTSRSGSVRGRPKNFYLSPLVLLAAIPVAMIIGAKGWILPTESPRPIATHCLQGLDLAIFLLAIYFVYRADGVRWLTASIALAVLWFYIAVSFFVGMSITGDWL